MSNTVELPRWLVLGGGLLLVGTISISAFLLGRTTAPAMNSHGTTSAPVDLALPPVQLVAPAAPTPVASEPTGSAQPNTTPRESSPRPQAIPTRTSSATHPTTTARSEAVSGRTTSNRAMKTNVDAYFQALERVGSRSAGSVDPNTLIQQAISGDVSGIDRLIADHKSRQRAIAAVQPPPPCTDHHERLTQLAADGLTVMQQLRTGIVSSNLGALASLQGRALRLQQLGEEVSQMEASLKNEYGLR